MCQKCPSLTPGYTLSNGILPVIFWSYFYHSIPSYVSVTPAPGVTYVPQLIHADPWVTYVSLILPEVMLVPLQSHADLTVPHPPSTLPGVTYVPQLTMVDPRVTYM